MTSSALAFLVAAAVLAVADWRAVAARDKRREYAFKPAVMVALIAAAFALRADGTQRLWFVAALVLSLAGDVFLMLPRNLFVPGLLAFLVAHLAYLGGFWCCEPPDTAVLIAAAAGIAVVVVILLPRVLRGAGRLAPAVNGYVAVISLMVASAIGTLDPLAAVGAVLFFASDALIAWTRFVRAYGWAPVTIMVLYHAGQGLLVASLAS